MVPIKTQKISLLHSEIWGDIISWLEVLIFLSDIRFSHIACLGKVSGEQPTLKYSSPDDLF